jgi:hypothetical protein
MTTRERRLAVILLGLGFAMGGGVLVHLVAVQPLSELRARVAQAQEDIASRRADLAQEQDRNKQILHTDPRLASWRQTSLPAARVPSAQELKRLGQTVDQVKTEHLRQLQVDYDRYLNDLLRRSGFTPASIKVVARPLEGKAPAGKGPPYTELSFTVTGRSRLEGVVRMLESFYRTPLLHKVRALTVQKGKSNQSDLDVNLTVEALLVNGAQARDTLLPPSGVAAKDPVLAEPARNYLALADKDIYFGPRAAPRQGEDRAEVLRFVRLTTLSYNGRRWEAYLYDQGRGGSEKMLTDSTITDFTVRDSNDSIVLEGTVVRIDGREMIFRAGGRYYRLHCGDFLYPAITQPLPAEEVRSLNLASAAP